MTKAMMRRLGRMITDDDYDLPERFAPELLDLGYIELVKGCMPLSHAIASISYYYPTQEGKDAFYAWLDKNEA